MIKQIIPIATIVTFVTMAYMTHPDRSCASEIKVPELPGVTLSITLNKDVLTVGSTTTVLHAEIKNISTNELYVVELPPDQAFTVMLTNSSGKAYQLTRNLIKLTRPPTSKRISLKSGETRTWPILLFIGRNIEVGEYTMYASRYFAVKNMGFKVVSNSLKVQVKGLGREGVKP